MLCMIFRRHFKFRFYKMFLDCWDHSGCPFGIICQKKTFRKWLEEKVPAKMKTKHIDMHAGSQRNRLARALLKQKNKTVRAQKVVRICFHCFFQKFVRKCCLNWFPLQMFQQHVRRNVKNQCQQHIIYDLAPPLAKAWRTVNLEALQ